MTDVKMTSVDSGVETGNDSNDSAQPENQQIQRFVKRPPAFNASTETQLQKRGELDPLTMDMRPPSTITTSMPTIVCQQAEEEIPNSPSSFKWNDNWTIALSKEWQTECLHFDSSPTPFKKDSWNLLEGEMSNGLESALKQFDQLQKHCRAMRYSLIPSRRRNSSPFYAFPCDRRMRLGAATNNIELVRRMLEKGLSPNNCDEQGRSPLHLASSRGYTDIVKLLLDYGADPNVTDCIGNTPLHLAAVTSKGSVVRLLLNAGTDVGSSDRHGKNPLQLAQTKLRMLQNCKGSDMHKIKDEVHKIVGMILNYLQKQKDACEQIDTLTSVYSRISLSNSTDQVQDDLKDLLASIDSLSLK